MSRKLTGRFGASVTMFAPSPDTQTRCFFHSGTKRLTGSSSWNRPCSNRVISATEVIGLVME